MSSTHVRVEAPTGVLGRAVVARTMQRYGVLVRVLQALFLCQSSVLVGAVEGPAAKTAKAAGTASCITTPVTLPALRKMCGEEVVWARCTLGRCGVVPKKAIFVDNEPAVVGATAVVWVAQT